MVGYASMLVDVEVVGFEGEFPKHYHITWGAAALRVGDRLVNPTTGLSLPIAALSELVGVGVLHLLPKPIRLEPSEAENPLIVVAVSKASPYHGLLVVERTPVVVEASFEEATYLVVRGREGLHQYSDDVIARVFSYALASEQLPGDALELVRVALVLDPHHPRLNALRVHLAPTDRREHVESLARACLRGNTEAFDTMLIRGK